MEKLLEELEKKMDSSLLLFRKELGTLRTGRASLSILDGVKVPYYGNPAPLNQVASLAVPESRLITIQPWDPSLIGEIEKAILKSDLGLNPTNDGKIIRIFIPPMTEERRKQLAKVLKKMAEERKIAVRNIRREGNEKFKALQKNKEIAEDDLHRQQEKIQKLTDNYIEKIDDLANKKEKEIMEV